MKKFLKKLFHFPRKIIVYYLYPDALPAPPERIGSTELHVHVRQLGRLVRRPRKKLQERTKVPGRQRGHILGREEQAKGHARRMQGEEDTRERTFHSPNNYFCSQHRQMESKTSFELKTRRLSELPIKDFLPVDYGLPHQVRQKYPVF